MMSVISLNMPYFSQFVHMSLDTSRFCECAFFTSQEKAIHCTGSARFIVHWLGLR